MQLAVAHPGHVLEDGVRVAVAQLGFLQARARHPPDGGVGVQSAEEERVDGGLAESHHDVRAVGVRQAGGSVEERLLALL